MLAQIVDEAALRFGDRTAVSAPDGDLSYSDLARASNMLAHELIAAGVGIGDIVALVLPSGGDWLVGAVAADRTGAAFAGISPVLAVEERSKLVRLLRPKVTLCAPELVDGLPLRSTVTVVQPGSRGLSADSDPSAGGAVGNTTLVTTRPPDEPAVICFTSGTTGTPKAAVYTDSQLAAIQRIDLGPDAETLWDGGSAMIASTQFAHVGMSTKFPWYIRRGMTLCVMSRWRADDAIRLVAKHRMPTIGAIAPQLALMLRSPVLSDLDVSSVQLVIAGGAASPPALVKEVRSRFDAGYSIRYSSTESGGVGLATDPFTEDETEWSTVGRPRSGVEVRISDGSDQPVATGAVGELQIRSDAVMSRYLNDPEATRRALSSDRWLRTGDLARIDEQERVVLAGRRSDMYIRGGYNVFPAEVEAILNNHPKVESVVIVPQADDVMGEVGVALIVVAGPEAPTLDELRDHAAPHLARYKLPERLQLVEEVPLTDAQKVDRQAARSLL